MGPDPSHIEDGAALLIIFCFSVEDMIKEVDVDGDGRIDFYGKIRNIFFVK